MTFESIQSKVVYRGRAFDIHKDEVRLPNGQTTQLDIVAHRGSITLVPVDADGRIWFIRQYRHAAGQVILELPAGVMEAGETPEKSALREIREEIGMSAGHIRKLGEFFLAPGYSTEYMYVYLATELKADPLPGDEDEFIRVEPMPFEKAMNLVESGQLHDAKTLAALLLAYPHLVQK